MPSTITQQTTATLQHHLTAIAQGDVDAILSDYTAESVLFLADNTLHGPEPIRNFFATILASLPADWMAHVATGWTLLACASASIAGQIRAMSRLRVLAFGSPVPPSGDTTTGHQMPERAGETSDDPSGRRPIGGA